MVKRRHIHLVMVLILAAIVVAPLLYIFGNTTQPSATLPSAFVSGLLGKSKAEVVSLLGQPQGGDLKTNEFYYRAGNGNAYMPGNTWAVIHFKNDRVVSVSKKED